MSQKVEKIQTFGRITKVNKATGIVEGVAMDETPDRDNEIFDYETSKPYVEQWSASQADTTKAAGQEVSYGNIRGQHDAKKAAGRIAEPIDFDDEAKRVIIKAKVVDPEELEKCYEGVYTGFSVKGPVVGNKWRDGRYMRYTVDPTEISLVDMPCNPGATFTAIKADGSTEEREFKVSKFAEGDIVEISGVRRFHGEAPQEFVERAVSTLVSKAAAEQPKPEGQEKRMTPEEQEQVAKAAAAEKMKQARKASNEISACVGGYCDHGDAKKCAEKVAEAHEHIAAAFADEGEKAAKAADAEKSKKDEKKDEAKKEDAEESTKSEDKKDEEDDAEKKKAKKDADEEDDKKEEKSEKAAGSEQVAALEAKIAELTKQVEKMASQESTDRPRPFISGTIVTKQQEVSKGAATETKDEPKADDPQRVEKALGRLYKDELVPVKL